MKCPKCNASSIPDKVLYCPYCGTALSPDVPQAPPAPVVKAKAKNPIRVAILCCTAFIVVVIVLIAAFNGRSGSALAPLSSAIVTVQATQDERLFNIIDIFDVSESQAVSIRARLLELGVERFIFESPQTDGDQTMAKYSIGLGEILVVAKVKYGELTAVQVNGQTIYSQRDGAIGNLNEFVLTSTERAEYQIQVEKITNALLKSPGSAQYEFGMSFKFKRYQDSVWIDTYVDSQNSFGALIRTDIAAQFKYPLIGEFEEIELFSLNGEIIIQDGKEV